MKWGRKLGGPARNDGQRERMHSDAALCRFDLEVPEKWRDDGQLFLDAITELPNVAVGAAELHIWRIIIRAVYG